MTSLGGVICGFPLYASLAAMQSADAETSNAQGATAKNCTHTRDMLPTSLVNGSIRSMMSLDGVTAFHTD